MVTRSGAQKAKIQTRAAVKAIESRKPSAALLEAKRKAKLKMNGQKTCDEVLIKDIFQNVIGKPVGYDEDFVVIKVHFLILGSKCSELGTRGNWDSLR